MDFDIFENISPLDHRYRGAKAWRRLAPYLSEAANIAYQLKVEAALVAGLCEAGVAPASAVQEVAAAIAHVTPAEVAAEEETTHHNIRALVNCIRNRVSDATKPFVHFSATSADIMDTANAMRYREATRDVVVPYLKDLLRELILIAEREAGSVQIGRTHGQFAVPITFGFAVANYVDRLGRRIVSLESAADNLRGKLAGAVGAYNAGSLFVPDPVALETRVMQLVGLSPSPISTQVVQAEFLLDYLHAVTSAFGVLANLADDFRHLQRSEIREIGEYFAPGQVGSSTMPHKRNPWNFEHAKSMWKEFMPRMVTVYMDQISEHQRDLTNSASARFVVEPILALSLTAERLTGVLKKLRVDEEAMRRNLADAGEMHIAEPLYLLLARHGHPDAHEAARRLTLAAEETGRPLLALIDEDEALRPYLKLFTEEQRSVLENPGTYVGVARKKAIQVAGEWREAMGIQD